MLTFIQRLGALSLSFVLETGRLGLFLVQTVIAVPAPPFRWQNLLKQIHFIGMRSLFVIALTSIFAGMVLALQGYYTLSRFGSEALLGPAVALSMIRELGPVLSGLMITGRAGSSMAAELGIMRIREQIDALEVMGVPPIHFLVVPRFLAGIIVLPLLTGIFDVIGIFGGYLVSVQLLGLSAGTYFGGIESAVSMHDINTGLIKALCFGIVITCICSFKGFFAQRGAEGVSQATTSAVVLSSVLILISDYFITAIML